MLAASGAQAPVAWSPDGAWLAYTLAEPAGAGTAPAALAPGWLTQEQPATRTTPEAAASTAAERPSPSEPLRYKIWATQRGTLASVLIEDSPHPVSSPAWGPGGHSLVYSRFIGDQADAPGNVVRGRYELVVQEALDRKRVLPMIPELEAASEQIAALAEIRASWSPDGRFIVIGRPGLVPGLLVVSPEQGRVLKTLDRAAQPAWSPDGSRLALLRLEREPSSGWSLQVMGRDFGGSRPLAGLVDPSSPPFWNIDGQSILIVAGKSRLQTRDLELTRVVLDTGTAARAFHLGSIRSEESQRSFAIGVDREQEQCIFSADDNSEVSALAFGSLSRQQRLKRFHPLDFSMRMGSVAFDPEGQLVAVRVETLGGMMPVLLCNPATEEVTLLAPDAVVRREWLATLLSKARDLLATALPAPVLDGRPIPRRGILPLPGEIPDQNPVLSRLRHLGKIGRSFLDQVPGMASASAGDEPPASSVDEFRVAFDFLRGEYRAALDDLDSLEARSEPGADAGRLLPLRAQVLYALGESQRARDVADYLVKSRRGAHLVEDTPAGPSLTSIEDPVTLWYRYLAQRLAAAPAPPTARPDDPTQEDEPVKLFPPHLLNDANGGEALRRPGLPFPNRLPPMPNLPGVRRFGPPLGPGRVPPRVLPPPFRPIFPERLMPPPRRRD